MFLFIAESGTLPRGRWVCLDAENDRILNQVDLGLLTLNLTNMGLLSMFSLRLVSLLSIALGDSSMMRMCILFQCCVVQDLQFL